MGGGRLARRVVRAREGGRGRERACESVDVERVDEDAGLGRHELRRPADPRGDDGAAARHRLEQRLTERLDEARLREDVARSEQARDLVVRDPTEQPRRSGVSRARRGPGRRRRTSASPPRVARTRRRGGRRSSARRARRRRGSAAGRRARAGRRSARGRRRSRRPRSCRAPRAASSRARGGGSRRRRSRSTARRTTRRVAAAIPGNAPMLRTSRPCAVTTSGARPGERGDQSRRDEEVRVDDVGLARGERPPRERQVAELPAGARVEDGELDLVPARDERPLDLRDERPEVGRVGPGIHLRDDQNPHRSRVFWPPDEGDEPDVGHRGRAARAFGLGPPARVVGVGQPGDGAGYVDHDAENAGGHASGDGPGCDDRVGR